MKSDTFMDYPSPDDWGMPGWVLYGGTLFIGGFGVFVLWQLPGSVSAQEWIQVAFFAALGISLLAMAAMPWSFRRRSLRGANIAVTDRGILIGQTSLLSIFSLASAGCMTLAALIFIRWVPSGALELPLTEGQRVFFPFAAGAVAVYGAIDVIAAIRYAPIGSLVLTSEEISFKRTATGRITLSWTDVIDVTIPSGSARKVHGISVKCGPQGSGRGANLDARWPSIGPAATFWLVRFYHRHPELRDELADHRVIDRIDSGGLLDPDDPKARMALRSM